jgi:hypothetical protein
MVYVCCERDHEEPRLTALRRDVAVAANSIARTFALGGGVAAAFVLIGTAVLAVADRLVLPGITNIFVLFLFPGGTLSAAIFVKRRHVQHVAIDPYQRSVWDNSGLLGLERAGLREYVEFHEQLSAVTLAALAAQGRTFDLIYIDRSHRFDDVFVDAYFSLRLLASRGVVMCDDSSTREVGRVLRFIERNLSSWVTELDLSSYRGSDASWRYQIARRLGRVQLRAFRRIGDEPSWDARLRNF